jgi:ectoine hydroxylase-related dioxygenase (phytanoyl-CoA dioxygenase family)
VGSSVSTQISTVRDALDVDGYAIVEAALTPAEVSDIRGALALLLDDTPSGRNDFEGFLTRRVYNLPSKTRALDRLYLDPLVLAVTDALLGHHQLCAAVAIDLGPGETAQDEHHDDGLYPLPRPYGEVLLSTMWALDDFTETNGATVMLPGSHRWERGRAPTDEDERRLAVMPAGSVALYRGTLWHGGGANRSAARRLGVTVEYVQSWLRPQESFLAGVPHDVVRALPERLQDLLGWNIRPPFMGYVDGLDPKRVLGITPSSSG